MAYTKYSLTPANNTAAPPDGAPEGMLPSAVNDTMRDMMAQIRDCGDGIRDGTYTMTAPKITGGTITGVAFTGNTFTSPVISGGTINNATIGATTATTGKFTTLEATGVTTVQAGTVSLPAITTTGDTNTGIFFPAADTIAFTEGGVESMRIDSSGNVGIGANITASAIGAPSLTVGTGSGSPAITLYSSTTGQSQISFADATSGTGAYDGFMFYDQNSRFMAFGTATAERMRIDSSGNVGIGNTTPSSYNSFGNQLVVGGSGDEGMTIVSGTANYGSIHFADGTSGADSYRGQVVYNHTNNAMSFSTDATERMRITSGGDLVVGTTATINSERLNVRQSSSANTTGIAVGYGTSAGQFRSMSIISTNAMTFNNGSNEATLSSAGAWTNASDARLKNNIVDIKYGLQTVLNTQPRSYKMNDLEGDYIGFVAQEIQTVIPEVVSGDPEKQLGVDYGSLVAVAFKAIQELKAELDSVKAELQTLKGN